MNPFKPIAFSKNRKKKDLLIIDGKYSLTKDGKTNHDNTTRWKCTQRDICTASVTLSADKSKILRQSRHTCDSNKNKIKIQILLDDMKKEVCTNLQPIQQIFEEMISKFVENNSAIPAYELPTYSSVKSSLYAARKSFLETDTLVFHKIEDVNIPTGLSKRFLILEDGNREKIVILCSRKMINLIKQARSLSYYGDGTFKACPRPFSQLYIIHLDVHSDEKSINIYPVVYAFLPNKRQETYKRLFKLINNKLGVHIKNFKCDYETAQINAIKKIYKGVKVTGCFQHYNKAIWKKAKEYNLLKKTTNNKMEFRSQRRFIRLCSYFVLLPSKFMTQAWHDIVATAPDSENMCKFVKYFEGQWIRMDHNLISCAEDIHRTTNSCEGYHHKINSKLPKNPNIFLVLKTIMDEAKFYDHKVATHLFLHYKKNRRAVDTIFDRKYAKLLKKLNDEKILPMDFLRKIVYYRLKLGF